MQSVGMWIYHSVCSNDTLSSDVSTKNIFMPGAVLSEGKWIYGRGSIVTQAPVAGNLFYFGTPCAY